MPSLGVYLSSDEIELVECAAKACGYDKVSPYLAEAVRSRLERDGFVEGKPAFDIRAEALSAAEIAGDDAVLQALRQVKASVFSAHASEERKVS